MDRIQNLCNFNKDSKMSRTKKRKIQLVWDLKSKIRNRLIRMKSMYKVSPVLFVNGLENYGNDFEQKR